MGNYISESDLTLRIGSSRLQNLCGVTGTDRTTLLTAVISRAEAVIDGFASVRYATPLLQTPFVSEWALCLAEHELYKRGPGGEIPQKIQRSYEDTIGQLSDLAAGRLETGAVLGTRLPSLQGSPVRVRSGQPPVFDPESMSGW